MTEKRVQHRHPRRNDSDCGNPFDIIKALFGNWYYTKKPVTS